jgi:hypothetical protein
MKARIVAAFALILIVFWLAHYWFNFSYSDSSSINMRDVNNPKSLVNNNSLTPKSSDNSINSAAKVQLVPRTNSGGLANVESGNSAIKADCLSDDDVFRELDNRREYEASYGSFSQSSDPAEMPTYWNYSLDELEQMALIDDVQAKYFLGVKLLFQAFGLEGYDNYYELPNAFEVEGKMVIQKTSSYFFGANGLDIKTRNESLLLKAREILYQAAVDGYITGMSWHIVSYDMERAFLEQSSQINAEMMHELKQNRLVSYAVLQHPFESKTGYFDLRPHDIELEEDNADNKDLIAKIKSAISQYDFDRNIKGLAKLSLEAYPKEWDELEDCE